MGGEKENCSCGPHHFSKEKEFCTVSIPWKQGVCCFDKDEIPQAMCTSSNAMVYPSPVVLMFRGSARGGGKCLTNILVSCPHPLGLHFVDQSTPPTYKLCVPNQCERASPTSVAKKDKV